MSVEKWQKLLALLDKRTRDGSIKWNEYSDGSFFVDIGDKKIDYDRTIVADGRVFYVVTVKNEQGQEVDQFTDEDITESPFDDHFEKMQSLYYFIRRQARGADEALDSLMKELEDPEHDPFE